MELEKIRMLNFRCFEDATIEGLSAFNLFAGLNGVGKSSILDAISVCLTGTCRGAENGRALSELRRGHSKRKWGVELDAIVGDKTHKLGRSEGEGPRSSQQQVVEQLTGLSASRIRACLYSGELMHLDRKAAQQLLVELCPASTVKPPVDVLERLAEFSTEEFLANIKTEWGLGDIDLLYDAVYRRRTEIGRQLREVGTAPAVPMPPHEKYRKMRLVDVEAEVMAMKSKLEELTSERAKWVAALERLKAAEAELEDRFRRVSQSIARAEAAENFDPEVEGLQKQAQELTKRKSKATTNIQHIRGLIADKSSESRAAREAVEAMRTQQANCTVCGSKLTAAKRKIRSAWLLEAADKADSDWRDFEERLEEELQVERNIAGDAHAIGVRYKEIEMIQADTKRRADEIGQRMKAAEDLKERMIELAAGKEEKTSEAQAAIKAMDERIPKGKERIEQMQRYLGMREEFERQSVGNRKDIQKKHDSLEFLVAELGPKGALRGELVSGDEMGTFIRYVGNKLVALGFAEVSMEPLLAMEDDVHVDGLPVRMLSDSQQILFGIALQVAIAEVTGLNVVAVDRWESLDSGSATAARRLLMASQCQSFVFQVLKDRDKFVAASTRIVSPAIGMYLVEEADVLRLPERGEG